MLGDDIVRKTNSAMISIYKVEEEIVTPDTPTTIANVDDLYFDRNTNQIYLTAGGTAIGGSISVSDLSNAIVDTSNEGLVSVVTD
jgi:hypothetical protein